MPDSIAEAYKRHHRKFLELNTPYQTLMQAGYTTLVLSHLAAECDLIGVAATYSDIINTLQEIGDKTPGPPARPTVLKFHHELKEALFEVMSKNCGCRLNHLSPTKVEELSSKAMLEWRLLEQVSLDKEPEM